MFYNPSNDPRMIANPVIPEGSSSTTMLSPNRIVIERQARTVIHDTYSINGHDGPEAAGSDPIIRYDSDGCRFTLRSSVPHVINHPEYNRVAFRCRDFTYRGKDISKSCVVRVRNEPYTLRKLNTPQTALMTTYANILQNSNAAPEGFFDEFLAGNFASTFFPNSADWVTIGECENQYDINILSASISGTHLAMNGMINGMVARYNDYTADERIFSNTTLVANPAYPGDPLEPPFLEGRVIRYTHVTAVLRESVITLDDSDEYNPKWTCTPPLILIFGKKYIDEVTPGNICLVMAIVCRSNIEIIDDNGSYYVHTSFDMENVTNPIVYPPKNSVSWTGVPGPTAQITAWMNQIRTELSPIDGDATVVGYLTAPFVNNTTLMVAVAGERHVAELIGTSADDFVYNPGSEEECVNFKLNLDIATYPSGVYPTHLIGVPLAVPWIGKQLYETLYLRCAHVKSRNKVLAVNDSKEDVRVNTHPHDTDEILCWFTADCSPRAPALPITDIIFHNRITIAIDWVCVRKERTLG